eukprot:TRINITY_DN4536_c1_g1_i1.p1 TRINITY_DN4536_c1_g1~~TRINITY_DN4536_c1_g1_i1.p1  ORF type:complete len:123 (+),score=18.02 TRINITY_DN4536_c1_g1_i1:292-660(+)
MFYIEDLVDLSRCRFLSTRLMCQVRVSLLKVALVADLFTTTTAIIATITTTTTSTSQCLASKKLCQRDKIFPSDLALKPRRSLYSSCVVVVPVVAAVAAVVAAAVIAIVVARLSDCYYGQFR